ncbi:MAG: glycosyltransferase [Ignavibacteriales bacterium]|nr:glycosyltransferase [Ignavibacteriales bacterium]
MNYHNLNTNKILLLSDCNSSHTIKWVTELSKYFKKITLFSFFRPNHNNFTNIRNLELIVCNTKISGNKLLRNSLSKIKYLKHLRKLKKVIKNFQPDILHAHFASSYGLLAALTNFHPLIISVWGYDIYEFPTKSFVNNFIIKHNLQKADIILSTSNVMKIEIQKYTNKDILVTPFGIDIENFKKKEVKSIFKKNEIVIGTVKLLKPKYGIDFLLRVFKILKDKYSTLPLKLLIVGFGEQEKELKDLAKKLNISNDTIFTGYIENHIVVDYYNMLNIFVALSISDSESFGVSILEASACELPVVVSDVGGLPEVVKDNITGFVVPRKNEEAAVSALERLIIDENLRDKMGSAGRKLVFDNYDWQICVQIMLNIYCNKIKKG